MKPEFTKLRVAVGALIVSGTALVGLVSHEGFTDKAVIPVKNDRPTVGFGSTFREDGSPVQMGDTITPQQALARTLAHINKDEAGIKTCVKVPLNQIEYDTMVDFAYQYGAHTLCKSSIVRYANVGNYASSCAAYLEYKYAGGYDCSTPGNKRCSGVWTRSQKRQQACTGAL